MFYRELSTFCQNSTEEAKLAQSSVSLDCSDFTGVSCQISIDLDLWGLIHLVFVCERFYPVIFQTWAAADY